MSEQFNQLRERLLRAGVAPRHVRRYIAELTDHLTDLRAEEEGAGRGRADAESAALARLGGIEDLSKAMIERRNVQSWSARAPWAIFALAPIVALCGAWFVALLILWLGWQIFLPLADTPFGGGPVYGFANLYFQADRALYFAAPVLLGWAIGLIAARQRLSALWLAGGLFLIALLGGTAQVHAGRTAVPGGLGHIRMDFTFGSTMPLVPYALSHALVILSLTALPYLIWRLHKAHSLSPPARN